MKEHLHVVVVGGGFGGLRVTQELRSAPVRVTLVDRRNHHLFQPLLYQVATAGLSAPDIAEPLRKVLQRQKNARVVLGEAVDVDREGRKLLLSDGELEYDYLVLAAGATNNYFGNDHWEAHAPGLKTLEEAFDIRRRVLMSYEYAERLSDPKKRAAWLTFVVIGAGPTGVEMAGALAEIAQMTLSRNFRNFDPAKECRVILVEGGSQVLNGFPDSLSQAAQEQLEELGVELRFGHLVSDIGPESVTIGEEVITTHNVIWAAGVSGEPIGSKLGVDLARGGRVPVTDALHIEGDERVFVIGDLAAFEQGGQQLPGVAPVALQMGSLVARNIQRNLQAKPYEGFTYFDKGSMATIGRRRAVAITGYGSHWPKAVPAKEFRGVMAWLAWLFVHIMVLIGYRNRIFVLMEWIYAYFTLNRSARVILNAKIDTEITAPQASVEAAE